jgi:hypothetical protein
MERVHARAHACVRARGCVCMWERGREGERERERERERESAAVERIVYVDRPVAPPPPPPVVYAPPPPPPVAAPPPPKENVGVGLSLERYQVTALACAVLQALSDII